MLRRAVVYIGAVGIIAVLVGLAIKLGAMLLA